MLATLLLCGSCNEEDNLTQIFVSGTWYLVDYYTDANWSRRNGIPKYNTLASDEETADEGKAALTTIQQFSLAFMADGTFSGRMEYGTLSGTWTANGSKRTLTLDILEDTSYSSYDTEFTNTLRNVAFYQGDSNFLMLAPSNKQSYIQFRHR